MERGEKYKGSEAPIFDQWKAGLRVGEARLHPQACARLEQRGPTMKLRTLLVSLIAMLVIGAVLSAILPLRRAPQPSQVIAAPQVSGSFARADGPRPLQFPRDHGPHNDFQTEWWYYTGNLSAANGARYGYQLTFFRRALVPPEQRARRSSDWAADQAYMAHFTLTDAESNRFRYFERLERGAAGLSGATPQKGNPGEPLYSVWLDDWSVKQLDANTYHLQAAAGEVRLDLTLTDVKWPVLQGDRGYSQKGPDPGNASYYYSQTQLESAGSLSLGEKPIDVSGLSWMDHEFSTSALAADQVGWDWFALQLDDGSQLMVYTIRKADGSLDAFSRGAFVAPDGSVTALDLSQFSVEIQGQWRSPHSGAVYPAAWTVRVPSEDLEIHIRPLIPDQELRVSFTYWEGAVQIEGRRAGQAVSGSGYVELTGYAGSMQGQF